MHNYEEYILASKNVADQIKVLNDRIKELEELLAQYQDLYDYKFIVV